MAFTKKFHFPINRLHAFQFDRALAFTRTRENTQAIARAYLVEHLSLAMITSQFKVSRQNIFRSVHTILRDAEIAMTTIEQLKPIYRRLRIKNDIHVLAHPFFFSEKTLDELSENLGTNKNDILYSAKYVIKKYRNFSSRDVIKVREQAFENLLPFVRVRQKSIDIAYDHLVLDETLTEVANKHGITPQNAYNIIQRFKIAEKRYHDSLNSKKKTEE